MNRESPKASFVHLSETRRKACNGCVKAKRRCDLVLPDCRRCEIKRLKCVYVDVIRDKASASKRTKSKIERIPKGSRSSDDEFQPEAPTGTPLDSIPASMSNYIITQFRGFIKSFVSDGETPFIHRSYQETIPNAFQDALSVCSLYVQKTPRNQDVIFRMLDSKLDKLLQDFNSSGVEENLLSLQALILYQSIRLLDGDVQQRANAERHLGLLDIWTLRFQQNYSQVISSPKVGYENWVLIESIRRTTMVSVILRALYFAMRDGYCELVELLATLSVSTGNSRLWTTDEEWEETKSVGEVLSYAEFTDEWNKGKVDGVKEYEKLLLMACRYVKVAGKLDPSS